MEARGVGRVVGRVVLVVLGSTVHAVFDRYTLLAGASGGVYALIGAHLAVVVMVIVLPILVYLY